MTSFAEQVKAAAADAGTTLSEWVRSALQHQAAVVSRDELHPGRHAAVAAQICELIGN
jgi:hypothetical protein